MPFRYELPLPDDSRLAVPCRLLQWHVKEWTKVDRGSPVATVEAGGAQYRVLANGPGYIYTLEVNEHATVKPNQCIAQVAADGECIPYGRPYSLLEAIEPSRSESEHKREKD